MVKYIQFILNVFFVLQEVLETSLAPEEGGDAQVPGSYHIKVTKQQAVDIENVTPKDIVIWIVWDSLCLTLASTCTQSLHPERLNVHNSIIMCYLFASDFSNIFNFLGYHYDTGEIGGMQNTLTGYDWVINQHSLYVVKRSPGFQILLQMICTMLHVATGLKTYCRYTCRNWLLIYAIQVT